MSIISTGSRPGRGAGRGPPRCGRRRSCGSPSRRPGGVGPSPGRPRPAPSPADTPDPTNPPGGQRGVAAGRLVPLLARPRRERLVGRQRPPGVGRRPGRVAQLAPRQPAAAKAGGQVAAVRGGLGDLADQRLADGDRPVVTIAGLGRAAERADQVGEVGVAAGQGVRGNRTPWGSARRVPAGSPGPRGMGRSASAGRPVATSRMPTRSRLCAGRCGTRRRAGFSSLSFRWIATASRYSVSASARRPICESR